MSTLSLLSLCSIPFIFPLAAPTIFSTTSFEQFDYDMPRCGFIMFLMLGCSLSFLNLWVLVLTKFGKVSLIISSNIFFSLSPFCPSFENSSCYYVRLSEVVSQHSDALFFLFLDSFTGCVFLSLFMPDNL